MIPIRSILAAALLSGGLLQAQAPSWSSLPAPDAIPAPKRVLDSLRLRSATVQDLRVPTGRREFRLPLVLATAIHELQLWPNDVRSPDFELLVDDGTTLRRLRTPPSVTYRGEIVGMPGSVVAASVIAGRLQATISLGQGAPAFGCEPMAGIDPREPAYRTVVFAVEDQLSDGTERCGVDDHAGLHTHDAPGGPSIQARKVAEIAIDCDFDYYQRNGSNPTSVTAAATTVLNACDAIYQRDVDIEYELTTLLVRTTRVYSTTSDMGSLLSEFRSRWNNNHAGIQRDVAHLFTGRGSFSGTVGIAYVGVICNLGYSYGVDKAFAGSTTRNAGLLAHELGHNWNAPHCNGNSPCRIMCSSLGGCDNSLAGFGTASINTIVNYRDSRGCLDDPIQTPTLTAITPTSLPVYPFRTIELRGSHFTGATRVQIGLTTVRDLTVLADDRISLTSPVPSLLGPQPVWVVNPAGTSNALLIDFQVTDPPTHYAPLGAYRNLRITFHELGGPNDDYLLHVSFNDPSTFRFQGFDILANTYPMDLGRLPGIGYHGFESQVPDIPLAGVQMYSQLITVDGTSGALDHVTAPIRTSFFY